MTYKNKIVKNSLIALVIALFTALVICLTCPPTAMAQEKSVGMGTEVSWEPVSSSLSLTSGTIFHDTLTSELVDACLNAVKVNKDKVRHITIKGFNYIAENALSNFWAMNSAKIEEPVTTAIRLSKNAISNNPSLFELELGGIEWKDTNNDDVDEPSISDNNSLDKVKIKFDNYDKYKGSIACYKLNKVMPNNGIGLHIRKHCKIEASDKNGTTKDTLRYYTNTFDGHRYWGPNQ